MTDILTISATLIADYLLAASVIAVGLVGGGWGLIKAGWIHGPVNRYMVWFITLIGIVVLPVIWIHGPKFTIAVFPAQNHFIESVAQQAGLLEDATPEVEKSLEVYASEPFQKISMWGSDPFTQVNAEPSSYKLPPVKTIFAWLWSLGFLFMLTRLIVGWHRLARLVKGAEDVPDSRRLGTGSLGRVNVMLSSRVDCPVCFGLVRPVILLPRQMYETGSRGDLEMVLRHELAHIHRKDCWVNLYQRAVEAVLFFHPLVWYASFQLTHQREQLCDNHVIAGGISPENYAELLTRIVARGVQKRSFQAVALFEGSLLSRVRRLLEPCAVIQVRTTHWAMISGMMVLMMWAAVGTIRVGIQQGPDTAQIHSGISNQTASPENRQEQTSKESAEVDQGHVFVMPAPDADSYVSGSMPAPGENEIKAVLQVEENIHESKPDSIMYDGDFSNDITKDAFPSLEKANNDGTDFQMMGSGIPANRNDLFTRKPMEIASLNTHVETRPLKVTAAHETEIENGDVTAKEAEKENLLNNKEESEPSNGNIRIPVGARIFNWKVIDRTIIIETHFYGSFKATLAEDCPKISSKDIAGIESAWPYAVTETSTILLSDGNECRIQKLVPYAEKRGNVYDVF